MSSLRLRMRVTLNSARAPARGRVLPQRQASGQSPQGAPSLRLQTWAFRTRPHCDSLAGPSGHPALQAALRAAFWAAQQAAAQASDRSPAGAFACAASQLHESAAERSADTQDIAAGSCCRAHGEPEPDCALPAPRVRTRPAGADPVRAAPLRRLALVACVHSGQRPAARRQGRAHLRHPLAADAGRVPSWLDGFIRAPSARDCTRPASPRTPACFPLE